MPYISTERVKEIREQLKKEFPAVKFSVTRYHMSTVNIVILAAPIKFDLPARGYEDVHYYDFKSSHYNEEQQKFLSRIRDIASEGKHTIVEDSDYGNVPNFYYHVSLGDFEKPYQYIEPKTSDKKQPPVEKKADGVEPDNGVRIVNYSDRAIAVIGNTKPIEDKLDQLGGKFNSHLTVGAGWIFSKTKLKAVQEVLGLTQEKEPSTDKKYILSRFKTSNSDEWKYYFTTIEDMESGDVDVPVTASDEIAKFTGQEANSLMNQIKDVIALNN